LLHKNRKFTINIDLKFYGSSFRFFLFLGV